MAYFVRFFFYVFSLRAWTRRGGYTLKAVNPEVGLVKGVVFLHLDME
jgi:hypothetical protein